MIFFPHPTPLRSSSLPKIYALPLSLKNKNKIAKNKNPTKLQKRKSK